MSENLCVKIIRLPLNRNIFLKISYERERQATEIRFVNYESPYVFFMICMLKYNLKTWSLVIYKPFFLRVIERFMKYKRCISLYKICPLSVFLEGSLAANPI